MTRDTDKLMSNVVHFPRHLARPTQEPMELPQYMERKYEMMFNEPWAALEDRVRARHPEFFAMYDAMEDESEEEPRKWWQIWK
jgi:hypothetical protein